MTKYDRQLEQWGPIDGKALYPSFWFWATAKLVHKKTGIWWPVYYGIFDHGRMTYFWYKQEMQKRGELALKKIILNQKKCRELWRHYQTACRRAMKIGDLKISAEKKFALLFDGLLGVWAYSLVCEVANFASPDYLKERLLKYLDAEQIDQVMEIMMAPEKLSFLQQGEQALHQAVLRAKNKDDLKQRLKDYAKNWFWLENSYYKNKVLTADYFYEQIKYLSRKETAVKLKAINQYESAMARKKLATGKKFHLPRHLMAQIKQIAFSLWWQDHRKALLWRLNGLVDELVAATGKKYGLIADDLYHYSAEEWRRLWRTGKKVAAKEIKQRKKFFALIVGQGGYQFFYGKKAKIIQKMLDEQNKMAGAELIKGIVVSRTKEKIIRGRVKIITSPRFAKKMRPGDILVAPMTSPDFIAVMRRAKAIITDVGGLMSHAAVVSRELGIPCIVNTKVATKALKDGDLVEVDAERGMVRKI